MEKNKKVIIGVMGPRDAAKKQLRDAFELGKLIALEGWITLTGGINAGVMDAVCQGAKREGGTTIGILPSESAKVSRWIDIPIRTSLDIARNSVNVRASTVVVACGIGAGTSTEVSMAIKIGRPVILLSPDVQTRAFFRKIGGTRVSTTHDPSGTIARIRHILNVKK